MLRTSIKLGLGRRDEQTQEKARFGFRKDVADPPAFRFQLFAVGACGYMDNEAVRLVHRLRDVLVIFFSAKCSQLYIDAESGRMPRGAFVYMAVTSANRLHPLIRRGNTHRCHYNTCHYNAPYVPGTASLVIGLR